MTLDRRARAKSSRRGTCECRPAIDRSTKSTDPAVALRGDFPTKVRITSSSFFRAMSKCGRCSVLVVVHCGGHHVRRKLIEWFCEFN